MRDTFIVAIKAILVNKVRSLLTMLGVIIGVGSVVLLTSIGTGLQAYVEEQFAALGTNTLYVVPGTPFSEGGGFGGQASVIEGTKPVLKKQYLRDILRDNRGVINDGLVMAVAINKAKYQNNEQKVSLLGTTANFETVYSTKTDKGEWFTKIDNEKKSPVVVLGPTVAEEFFGKIDPIGKKMKIGSKSYKVVGVTEEKGGGFGGPSFDSYVYIPVETLYDDLDVQFIDNFTLKANEDLDIKVAIKAVEETMLKELDEDEFTVVDQTQILETITGILGMFTIGLGGISAISLVVGGIGIMNIMLVSVTERTREIGLRKALGATPNTILTQFLIEAALLSLIGGLIGLIIAYLGSLALQPYFPAKVTMNAVLMAFGVSTAVGLFFGAAPAKKAASLSPIEALRYE
ncbi:MAG: FtsX-like permease family protein [Candidatus Pacebacteria bacterium]|nr:FtsX-like permease family protein [Candidatus Paceibacterota bacterium]